MKKRRLIKSNDVKAAHRARWHLIVKYGKDSLYSHIEEFTAKFHEINSRLYAKYPKGTRR